MSWRYSAERYRRETMERLAESYGERLRELIAHCQQAGAGGYTPSDFPAMKLSQDKLDALIARLDALHHSSHE
jgi:non-ribosomal peptide synthase protein (TIGR01720 family)